jgi:pimeloyl-ACP methyl ester carboxylesterase
MALMNLININGNPLEVQKVSPNPLFEGLAPLVFLHEGLGSIAMWRDWPAQLCAATGRVGWVYSRRGYGQSEAIPDVRGSGQLQPDYLHHEAWTVLPALLQALAIKRPVLVGHSDGGSIALLHASRHAISACVVMAPHTLVEDVSVKAIEAARTSFESGALRERLARFHADVDGAFWQWNDIWLHPAFRDFDIREDCKRIKAPVLAVQGVDDPYGSLQQIEQINLPPAQITRLILQECGHSPHREQTVLTTQAIRQFLASAP